MLAVVVEGIMATMKQDNWVLARANCTLDDNLTAIIGRVKRDVQSYNALRPDKRGIRQFRVFHDNGEFVIKRMAEISDHRGTEVVEDVSYKGDVITVQCTETAISVRRKEHLNFEIEPRWNPESQTCDLLVDGEIHPMWRISEMIVGNFLFE